MLDCCNYIPTALSWWTGGYRGDVAAPSQSAKRVSELPASPIPRTRTQSPPPSSITNPQNIRNNRHLSPRIILIMPSTTYKNIVVCKSPVSLRTRPNNVGVHRSLPRKHPGEGLIANVTSSDFQTKDPYAGNACRGGTCFSPNKVIGVGHLSFRALITVQKQGRFQYRWVHWHW